MSLRGGLNPNQKETKLFRHTEKQNKKTLRFSEQSPGPPGDSYRELGQLASGAGVTSKKTENAFAWSLGWAISYRELG